MPREPKRKKALSRGARLDPNVSGWAGLRPSLARRQLSRLAFARESDRKSRPTCIGRPVFFSGRGEGEAGLLDPPPRVP